VTVLLKNSSIKDAIDSLLLTNQLDKKVINANTLFIFPATAQKQKDYQELVIRNFFFSNADAKQAMAMLKAILKVNDIYIDEKRNTLVLRDTPEMVALAEKLIAAHDQPDPEVVLVVEVLEITAGRLSEIGMEFPTKIKFSVGDVTTPATLYDLKNLNSSMVNVTGIDPLLVLNLKKALADSKLLANPRIRVRNREKAKIHIGDRVPYSTAITNGTTSLVTQNITYIDTGLKLDVETQVFMDNEVAIKVALEVSAVTKEVAVGDGQFVPQVGTRTASTTLSLKHGETQILAGLIRNDEIIGTNRLPGLGDIPVLGRLFTSENSSGLKSEILLSITPYIVRNIEQPSAALTEYLSGPDSRVRSAGLASTSAPNPAPAKVGAGDTARPQSANSGGAPASSASIAVPAPASAGTTVSVTPAISPATGTPNFETPPGFTVPAN
jgi:general secretion pathway protein D